MYLFIDADNVWPSADDLRKLRQDSDAKIWFFVPKNRANLPVDLVAELLKFGSRLSVVRMRHAGKNAMDFLIAFSIGQVAKHSPRPIRVAVLSNDKGFDGFLRQLSEDGIAEKILRSSSMDHILGFLHR